MYLLLSAWTARWFPFVHSDEPWLALLTHQMIETRSFAATEPFFHLTPRYPHAIKVLFHLLQAPFVAFSRSPLSVRLLSIIASAATLGLVAAAERRIAGTSGVPHPEAGARRGATPSDPGTPGVPHPEAGARRGATPSDPGTPGVPHPEAGEPKDVTPSAPGTGGDERGFVGSSGPRAAASRRKFFPWAALLLALDVQFIYISHLARQEALILLVLTVVILVGLSDGLRHGGAPMDRGTEHHTVSRQWVLLGALVGLAAGIHPNAFVAGVVGVMLAGSGPGTGKPRVARTGLFAGAALAGAAVFVIWSLAMDSGFIGHYLGFGSAVGVTDGLWARWFRFVRFLEKVYHQWAGTYYLPPVRFQLVLFAVAHVAAVALIAVRDALSRLMARLGLVTIAVLTALFIIGKYSPPSIVLIWPSSWLLTVTVIRRIAGRLKGAPARILTLTALGAILATVTIQAMTEIERRREYPYGDYVREIREIVPPDARVLANLNTGFEFSPDRLFVYRDLAKLDRPIGRQLRDWQVDYILYPEEMDVIYRERPVWNDLYGNLHPYYAELQEFLRDEAQVVGEIESPVYGMRIVPKMDDHPWTVRIYRVTSPLPTR